MLPALVIWTLTTHPFRDGARFLLLIETPSNIWAVKTLFSIYCVKTVYVSPVYPFPVSPSVGLTGGEKCSPIKNVMPCSRYKAKRKCENKASFQRYCVKAPRNEDFFVLPKKLPCLYRSRRRWKRSTPRHPRSCRCDAGVLFRLVLPLESLNGPSGKYATKQKG